MGHVLNGQAAIAVVILCAYAAARALAGKLDRERRVNYDNAALLHYYTAGQVLLGLVLVHGFPRLIG